ncbi:MAG: hypothetical protein IIA45_11955 [Bacteroidetes bacterium]|nr:hypothetical protein [Bacteroidota bacterium]
MEESNNIPIIETENGATYLREDGIIHYTGKKNYGEDLGTSKENVAANRKVGHYQKRPLLIDTRGNISLTKESRDYYSSAEVTDYFSSIALLTDGMISQVICNFYMGINKPATPTRLFTNEQKAILWLKKYI